LEITDIKKQHQQTVDYLWVRHHSTLGIYKKEHAISNLKKNTKIHVADHHVQEMNEFYFELSDKICHAKQLAISSIKETIDTTRLQDVKCFSKFKSQHQRINSLTDELCNKDNVIQELTEKVEQYKEVIDFI
jgi:predicted RNase H-like nuclease (RuvC/YqgF family)